jgi:hypothetical protein
MTVLRSGLRILRQRPRPDELLFHAEQQESAVSNHSNRQWRSGDAELERFGQHRGSRQVAQGASGQGRRCRNVHRVRHDQQAAWKGIARGHIPRTATAQNDDWQCHHSRGGHGRRSGIRSTPPRHLRHHQGRESRAAGDIRCQHQRRHPLHAHRRVGQGRQLAVGFSLQWGCCNTPTNVTVSANASALAAGTYVGQINVMQYGANPAESMTIPVVLNVASALDEASAITTNGEAP